MSAAHVRINDITKIYDSGRTRALESIDLEIRRGEFVVLVGPSGCGKSTLLNIVAGLEEPTLGSVGYPDSQKIDRSRTSVAFQDPSLFEWRTVRKNVEVGPEVLGTPRDTRRRLAEESLELVGVAEFADSYPHRLSGGMRQRVGLARAFATSPQLLIMDEPFSSVDHFTKLRLQSEVLRLREQAGATVLFVTHDVSEAAYLADRVIVMSPRPGRIVQEFTIDLPHPRPRFARELVEVEDAIYREFGLDTAQEDTEHA